MLKIASVLVLLAMVGPSVCNVKEDIQAINVYLVEKVKSSDSEPNLKAIKEAYLPGSNNQVLQALKAVASTGGSSICSADYGKALNTIGKAIGTNAFRWPKTRLEKVVNVVLGQHAKYCRGKFEEKFKSLGPANDIWYLRHFFKFMGGKTPNSGTNHFFAYTDITTNDSHPIAKRKYFSDFFYTLRSRGRQAGDGSTNYMEERHYNELTGEPDAKPEPFTKMLDQHFIRQCESFVKKMDDFFSYARPTFEYLDENFVDRYTELTENIQAAYYSNGMCKFYLAHQSELLEALAGFMNTPQFG